MDASCDGVPPGEDAVCARLARIDALDEAGAPPDYLIEELRALAGEAAAWVDAGGEGQDGPWAGVDVVTPGGAGAGAGAVARGAGDAGRLAVARAVARLQATLERGLRAM